MISVQLIKCGVQIYLFSKHKYYFRRALDRMIADHFPMKSAEFPINSPKYNDYITALTKVIIWNINIILITVIGFANTFGLYTSLSSNE